MANPPLQKYKTAKFLFLVLWIQATFFLSWRQLSTATIGIKKRVSFSLELAWMKMKWEWRKWGFLQKEIGLLTSKGTLTFKFNFDSVIRLEKKAEIFWGLSDYQDILIWSNLIHLYLQLKCLKWCMNNAIFPYGENQYNRSEIVKFFQALCFQSIVLIVIEIHWNRK